MKYKVAYTLTTRSRYGAYVYSYTETVEADSKESAISAVKEANAKPRWKFSVKSVEAL